MVALVKSPPPPLSTTLQPRLRGPGLYGSISCALLFLVGEKDACRCCGACGHGKGHLLLWR